MKHFQGKTYPHHLKYFTFWPRFWGPHIDGIILWPLIVLIPFVLQVTVFKSQTTSWVIPIFTCVIQFSYSIYFNGRYGGTFGKLKCNLRILDHKTEMPISYKQAFLRDSVPVALIVIMLLLAGSSSSPENSPQLLYVSAILGLWFLAEILTMLTNSKRRALHDFIAGTVVVRTNTIQDFSNQNFHSIADSARSE